MTVDDFLEFGQALSQTAATFGAQTTPDLIDGYFEALKSFPLADAKRALREAVDKCKFFPRPSELRAFASGLPQSRVLDGAYYRPRHPGPPPEVQRYTEAYWKARGDGKTIPEAILIGKAAM